MRFTIHTHPPSGEAASPIPNRDTTQSSLETSPTSSHEIHVEISGGISPTSNTASPKTSTSPYVHQICAAMVRRLEEVPDFKVYSEEINENEPVDALWTLFRQGHPLLTIYNSIQPRSMLKVEARDATKAEKAEIAIFQFIEACRTELKVPSSDRFVIADLLSNDTSQLMKIIHVINYHILDLAERRGNLEPPVFRAGLPPAINQRTSANAVVRELISTERLYVKSLADLQSLKETLIDKGIVPSNMVDRIFLNVEDILECHRLFLDRMEDINAMPISQQQWGILFYDFEDGFEVYYRFIANNRKASKAINEIFHEDQPTNHPRAEAGREASLTGQLNYKCMLESAMLRPLSRIAKYPLLLTEMIKRSEDEEAKCDFSYGLDSAERVLKRVNRIMEKALLKETFEDLMSRMEDWKEYDVMKFGDLLLHGDFKITTDVVGKQKDYKVYLFECVLICCKEVRDEAKGSERGQGSGENKTKLRLKGRVFTINMIEVADISELGSYIVMVRWKGHDNVKSHFTIKFSNEAAMKKWADQLERQRFEAARKAPSTMPRPPPPRLEELSTVPVL